MTLVAPAAVVGATRRSAPPSGRQNGCSSMVSLHVAMYTPAYLATARPPQGRRLRPHEVHEDTSLHAQRGKEGKETDHNVDPGIVAALVLHKLNAMKCAA